MNNSLKNIFSFIKEVLELKNKNIYTIDDYEIHEDFGQFYTKFKEIIDPIDYRSFNINSENVIFKIKYIKEDKKKKIPDVPYSLKEYISVENGNDIISKIDNLEITLSEKGLLDSYKLFDNEVKEINRYNNIIDLYNAKYMQFYNVYKRINDYEEKLEVVFGQKLMVWHDHHNNKIKRYIYEANLDMHVDPINNTISFSISNEKFKGFASDFLNLDSYKIKDVSSFYDYIKKFNDEIISTDFDVNSEAQKYVNYISLDNTIIDDELNSNYELKNSRTYLFDNYGIVVRNKNIKLWIEDLEKIISLCDSTTFYSPILNLFEVNFDDSQQVNNLLNDKTYFNTKDDYVLFPLPSNDEQYKIVDKVKSSNIVLVQGPPGTGKSHTIANLLSHYISEGKKVIVTSEKAKALEVLRDKIPNQIRSLSLSLLTSKGVDKDLEFSINTILKHQVDDNELNKIKEKIESLSTELRDNHEAKQNIIRDIIDLMSKDIKSHKKELNDIMGMSDNKNLTLMDIAQWLNNNKVYNLVPLDDNANYFYPNCKEFFEKLDDICDDIKNNCYAISSPIPQYDRIISNDIEMYIKERLGYKNYQIKNSDLINAIKQSSLDDNVITRLANVLDKVKIIYKYFDKNFVIENVKYKVFMMKLKELINDITSSKNFFTLSEEKIFDYTIEFNDDNKISYLERINRLISFYDENGKLSLINKLKFLSELKKLDGLLVNQRLLQERNLSKDDLCEIRDVINYYILVDKIRLKIKQIFNVDLFEKINIKKNQFGKYLDDLLDIFNGFVNFEDYVTEIDNCFASVINKNLYSIKYLDSDEDFIIDVFNDLKYYVARKSSADKTNQIVDEIRNFYKDYNLQTIEKMLSAIETVQLDEYINAKNQLLHEIGIINKYNDLKKLYSNLVEDKRGFIENYIYRMSFEEKSFFKLNIDKVFKYHYIKKYYLNCESKESQLPSLYEQRNLLISEEKRIITELVATKGWYYQNKNMSPAISASLNKWINLKKKLGGGTGKNTNLYLKQMRVEMATAKNAIPVWIMPIDKLIEQYPFTNDPPFDVLIMDESSQTSVYSISALSRAKKIIIVGDDKQISPTNAFTSIDEINDIRTKYLRNNNWDLQISKDTSIYDIIQTICGSKKITLTEHFRCLPEIIHYSNKMFYNMEINPLKVRSKENTIDKPIKTIYVPNAVCRKSGNQIINDAELRRIIELIADMSADKQYNNKSIGIITLQNNMNKYIQLLNEALVTKFGENFIIERNLKIGTTYDFQGDERDVIILSMGIASSYGNGEKYHFKALTTKDFDRSFNVAASRAKEQMILVHSVQLEELSSACNRYKLLNYCLNYDKEEIQNIEKLFESPFEKDVYDCLNARGYKLIPQFVVGHYRIDFVLTNDNNQKIAIECDGDIYHRVDELENDLKKQSILERCGWKFVRIRASEFYYDRDTTIKQLIESVESYLNSNNSISFNSDESNNKSNILQQDNIEYLESNSNVQENLFKKELNTEIENFGPSQFKYMTLFSNGISRREIADYYDVAYDTVKKSLQVVCEKYNCNVAENCIDAFKKQWGSYLEYSQILHDFNNRKLEDTVNTTDDFKDFFDDLKEECVLDKEQLIKILKEAIVSKSNVRIEYFEIKKQFVLRPINYYEANGKYYLKAVDLNGNQIKSFKFEKIYNISII